MHEMVVERAPWRGRALGIALIVLPLWLVSWWRLVFLPEDILVTNVLVDDALYFALPARHWWEGHGFSFDGIEPTNGVQTLWALVCVGLAGVFVEPLSMLRAMVGLSALCWLLAGFGLLALLRRQAPLAGVVAAVGFAWAGVHDRVAFQGMENGLHALVGVLVLLAGSHAIRMQWSLRATLWLGLALALFGLSRTEGVLLGPMIALPMVLGWLRAPGGFARRAGTALWLAAPGVVLVGGACTLSKLWFDSFLPISGSVKQFYESSWGGYDDPGHHAAGKGGAWHAARWHVQFATRLSLAPLRVHLPAMLGDITALGHRPFRNAVWVLLAAGFVAGLLRRRSGRAAGLADASRGIVWCFVAYAILHAVLVGLTLSHFTSYAKWYFASEATTVWLVLAMLVPSSSRWAWRGGFVLAVLLSVAGAVDGGNVTHDVRTNQFKKAGEWLREHTPPGTVVGALSSGLVGWYASEQHVVNLDGLINNRRYLDEYLSKDRFADYFADRGITWFADYQPIAGWKHGISWRGNVPASRLVPRRYWRMPDDHAYVIWQVLPEGETFELLGEEGPTIRDRYAELAVAADVHGRYPVVGDGGAGVPQGAIAVRALPDGGSGPMRRVYATPAEIQLIAWSDATVQPEHSERLQIAPGMEALGYDAREHRHGGERSVAITLFLQRTAQAEQVDVWIAVRSESGSASGYAGFGPRSELWRLPPATICAPTERLPIVGDGPYSIGIGAARSGDGRAPAISEMRWFTR